MTIHNFHSYSDEKLLELRDSLGLSMDVQILTLCKQHYVSSGKTSITSSELRIIDEVFKATPYDASNAAITNLICENNDIIATFNDLLSKHTHLSGAKTPLSLSSAAKISSKYMNMIGLKMPPIPEKIAKDIENKKPSLVADIIETAKQYDKNSFISVVADRLHSEQFEIDDQAFCKYFLPTVNQLIDDILSLIACGYDCQLISLYIRYNFPKNANAKTLGDCLATILGAYRVMCELCITDVSLVNHTDSDDVSVTTSLFAKSKKSYIPTKLNANQAKLYLISFDKLENGMPDFESFRAMCERYRILASYGKVKSALAINGNLRDAISNMEGDFRFVPNEKASEILGESFCGILLESYLHPKNSILLGSTKEIPHNSLPSEVNGAINSSPVDIASQNQGVLTVNRSDKTSEHQNTSEALEQIGENTQKNS